jgi:hypothetical protein
MFSMTVEDRFKTSESSQILAVSEADLPGIAGFLAEWPDEPMREDQWRARFDHWWSSNPYYEKESVRGYVIKDQDRIVGFCGLIPMPFQLAGRERLVFASSTWRVLPKYRHSSVGLFSQILEAGKETLVFSWSGVENVVLIWVALGYRRIPRPAAFSRRTPSLLVLQLDNASRFLLRAGGIALRAHAYLTWRRTRFAGRRLESRRLESATEEVNRFWERTRSQTANTQLRSSKFFNWYCFSGSVFPKRLYGCYRNGDLCGLAMMAEKTARGLRLLECLDLWVDWEVPGVVDALFSRAIGDSWKEGFQLIQLPPFTEKIERFSRSRWLLPRKDTRHPEFVYGPVEQLETLLTGDTALFQPIGDYGL